jgi:hypothetical protein
METGRASVLSGGADEGTALGGSYTAMENARAELAGLASDAGAPAADDGFSISAPDPAAVGAGAGAAALVIAAAAFAARNRRREQLA